MKWPLDEITTQHIGLAIIALLGAFSQLVTAIARRIARRRRQG